MKKNSMVLLVSLFVCILFGCSTQQIDETSFYVSPSGNDSWSGRFAESNSGMTDGPFATLEKARDAIREMKEKKGLPRGGLTVWLRGGAYHRNSTFELDERDSGTKEAPVVYRSFNDEEVRLVGGKEIETSTFRPVTDAAILKRIDPNAQPR